MVNECFASGSGRKKLVGVSFLKLVSLKEYFCKSSISTYLVFLVVSHLITASSFFASILTIHGNRVGLHTWAVVPAGQLQDVGIELFHTLHKLTNADTLGFLQHVPDVVPLLLCHVVGEHGEKVEHDTVFERLA
jgi:hypothetical protein